MSKKKAIVNDFTSHNLHKIKKDVVRNANCMHLKIEVL